MSLLRSSALVVALGTLALGCSDPTPASDAAAAIDAGARDAARADGGSDATAIDAARVDASATDASATDASLLDAAPAIDTGTDTGSDAGSDANVCGFIGGPCDSSMISAPDCPFGFVCYGGAWTDARASGVCLSAVGPRTECDASHLCPGAFGGAGTRCYLPYTICLYSYEVPCVCNDPAAAANCGPPS